MGQKITTYPELSDSKVSWLGSIPSHWKLLPGYSVLSERNEKNKGMIEKTVLSLSYGRVVVKPPEKFHGLVPESFETYQIVNPGNIIVRPTDLQNDKTSLRVGLAKDRGIITSAYLCLQPNKNMLPEYAYQLLHSHDVMKIFYGLGSGLRQNLDFKDIKRLPLVVPPLEEQQKIVNFIQRQDRRIRRFIKNKKRLIELLVDQKQRQVLSILSSGLNPKHEFVDTAGQWSSPLPSSWQLLKIKYCARVLRGKFSHRPRNDPALYGGEYPFIQTGDVARANKFVTSYSQTLNESGRKVSKQFPKGTVVMTIAANIGDVAIIGYDACFPDSIVGFFPYRFIDNEFLYVALSALKQQFLQDAPVNTQGNLNVERISRRRIPVPPLEEQAAIVKAINERCLRLDQTISQAKAEIDLVNEYRSRLIADAVTGKIDLRSIPLEATEESPDEDLSDTSENGLDADAEMNADEEELLEEAAHAN